MSIQIHNVSKRYGKFEAVRNVSLNVEEGELVALLGPSGSGKTTLLRIIAGLEQPDSGVILLNNQDATLQSASRRGVGFVFQHYALFRHMTVAENVAFGLRVQPRAVRLLGNQIQERVQELLRLVQLESQAGRYPTQLSGGQRQRVALARALAVQPKVLLLDEPFGALDAKVRKELRRWLRRLHDEIHVTSVLVTHDQEEALEVADRVAIMNAGQIEQVGTPEEVYDHPATPFVFDFLGKVNLFHGRIEAGLASLGSLELAAPEHIGQVSGPAFGYVRPHDVEIMRHEEEGEPAIRAHITQISGAGPHARIELVRVDSGETIEAELPKLRYQELGLRTGEIVFVKPLAIRLFAGSPPV
ncbi:MAG TPA: sulfate ABC transporter ATP-binding protein [Candidatus Angelobacter sp.]|nr:sulfate ABC transporter ATP-binding protein [Candidatus Angelobacter sp.]